VPLLSDDGTYYINIAAVPEQSSRYGKSKFVSGGTYIPV
jgi:hypothetical protein